MALQYDGVVSGDEGDKAGGTYPLEAADNHNDNETQDDDFRSDLKEIGEDEETYDAEEALVTSMESDKKKKKSMMSKFFSCLKSNRSYVKADDGDMVMMRSTPHGHTESSEASAIRPGIPMIAMDSSRGLGVILVIIWHMGYESFKNAWWNLFIFFSISGYVITKTTVEAFERRGTVDVLNFWAKRVSRLFPALLLTINIIALSQKLPYRQDHHNDGVQFQREGVDLMYSTIFLTNINLVFNQVDDHFNAFTAPSITRHLWTLSIEGQYYIIWPLFLYVVTRCTVGNEKALKDKVHVKSILVFASFFIVASISSSLIFVEKMGTSAAYFSTLSHMGDIAIGGFVYSATRLIPAIDSRMRAAYTDEDGCLVKCAPLTFSEQIFCEFWSAIGFAGVFLLSLIQTEADDLLHFYFNGGSLVTLIFTIGITAACILAADGPLPRWAIFTKFWCSKILAFVGVLSYGLYMFHWPIIVFFGDPIGAHRKNVALGLAEDDGSDDNYMLRDLVIFIVVMILGYISFSFYEKPLLLLSRRTKPWKTLVTGFAAMAVTLFTIWAVTKNLPPTMTFENDANAVTENPPPPITFENDANAVTETPPPPITFENDANEAPCTVDVDRVIDDRYTPIITDVDGKWAFMVEDFNSRSEFREMNNDDSTEVMLSKYPIYVPGGERNANTTILMTCMHLDDMMNPCEMDFFVQPTYWVWLRAKMCYKSEFAKIQHRCENKIHQVVVNYERSEHEIAIKEQGLQLTEDENQERMRRILIEVDKVIPGVINQRAMQKIINEANGVTLFSGDGEPFDPITMTMIGESVGERIALFWVRIQHVRNLYDFIR